MALKREHCSIKAVATMLIGILLLSTVDIVHAQMQVTAKGDEYSLYYGFERYGIIGSYPETWTNDIVYDHNNNRIILTDHTFSSIPINRWTVQIYDTEGRLLNQIEVPLDPRSSVEYDHVNNRIIVGGVAHRDQNNNIRSSVYVYDGTNYNLRAVYPTPGSYDLIFDVAYDTARGKILVALLSYDQSGRHLQISMIDDAGNFAHIINFDDCIGNEGLLGYLSNISVKPIGLIYDSKNNRIFVFCNFEDAQNNEIGRIYVMRYDEQQNTYIITAGPFDVRTNIAAEGIGLAYDRNRDRLIVAGLEGGRFGRIIGAFDARSDTIDTQNPLFTIEFISFGGVSRNIGPYFKVSSKITYDNNHDRIIAADVGRDNSNRFHEAIDIFGRSNSTIEVYEGEDLSDGSVERAGDSIKVRYSTENILYDNLSLSWRIRLPADAVDTPEERTELSNLCSLYNPRTEGYSCSASIPPEGYLYISKYLRLTQDNMAGEVTFRFPLPGEWRLTAIATVNRDKANEILSRMELEGYVSTDEFIVFNGVPIRVLSGILLYKGDSQSPTILLNRTINLGESMTIKVMTVDENVKKVKFTWIRPDNSTAREQTVQISDITTPITGKGAEDTYTPDQAGDGWKVKVEFQDDSGNTLYQEEVTFNVRDQSGGGGGGGGEEPTYILELTSNNSPLVDNGNRDLGSSITANIRTNVGTVNNVVLRWLYIQDSQEQTIMEHTVQVSDSRASYTFTPDRAGAWKVIAIFRNNENALHTIEKRFTINPINNISVSDNQGNSINLTITQGDNLISLPKIEPNPDQMPQIPNAVNVNIPYGLLSFEANTNNDEWLTIDIQYPSQLPELRNNQYYAYLKRINNEWKIMNMDTSNQDGYFELVSNTTIRLHIKDNGAFDANNALGVVSDPGGIAVVTTTTQQPPAGGGGGGGGGGGAIGGGGGGGTVVIQPSKSTVSTSLTISKQITGKEFIISGIIADDKGRLDIDALVSITFTGKTGLSKVYTAEVKNGEYKLTVNAVDVLKAVKSRDVSITVEFQGIDKQVTPTRIVEYKGSKMQDTAKIAIDELAEKVRKGKNAFMLVLDNLTDHNIAKITFHAEDKDGKGKIIVVKTKDFDRKRVSMHEVELNARKSISFTDIVKIAIVKEGKVTYKVYDDKGMLIKEGVLQ
jgi:hypothetical protein